MGDDSKDTTMDKIITLTTSVAPQGISTKKTAVLTTKSFMTAASMNKSKGLLNGVVFSWPQTCFNEIYTLQQQYCGKGIEHFHSTVVCKYLKPVCIFSLYHSAQFALYIHTYKYTYIIYTYIFLISCQLHVMSCWRLLLITLNIFIKYNYTVILYLTRSVIITHQNFTNTKINFCIPIFGLIIRVESVISNMLMILVTDYSHNEHH